MLLTVRMLLLLHAANFADVAGIVLDGDTSKPMPSLGFGTCCRRSAKGPALIASTAEYLKQGGRHIDTAEMYSNHRDIAVALHKSGVPRDRIWLTSKVNTKVVQARATAVQAIESDVSDLGVAHVDLMLIHGVWTLGEEAMVIAAEPYAD